MWSNSSSTPCCYVVPGTAAARQLLYTAYKHAELTDAAIVCRCNSGSSKHDYLARGAIATKVLAERMQPSPMARMQLTQK